MRKMMCNNPNDDLVNMNAYVKFGKIKGHNTGTNVRKMTANNPNVDLVSTNSYIKFGQNLSICFDYIKHIFYCV